QTDRAKESNRATFPPMDAAGPAARWFDRGLSALVATDARAGFSALSRLQPASLVPWPVHHHTIANISRTNSRGTAPPYCAGRPEGYPKGLYSARQVQRGRWWTSRSRTLPRKKQQNTTDVHRQRFFRSWRVPWPKPLLPG